MFGIRNDVEFCDFCGNEAHESYFTGKNKLVCSDCADHLQVCDSCGEYKEDEEFSYNQEICDSCCDRKADMIQDKD